MLVVRYETKKSMREHIGKRLRYIETSLFGDEYKSDGTFVVCNRPHMTGAKREFFAEVTMKDNLIAGVK